MLKSKELGISMDEVEVSTCPREASAEPREDDIEKVRKDTPRSPMIYLFEASSSGTVARIKKDRERIENVLKDLNILIPEEEIIIDGKTTGRDDKVVIETATLMEIDFHHLASRLQAPIIWMRWSKGHMICRSHHLVHRTIN